MEAILAELEREQAVSVAHLCQVTGVSEATIRRNLNELARRGKLNEVCGGALPIREEFREEFREEEPNMDVKRQLHSPEKLRIAQYAAGLITDDNVVYLDAGSTILHMVEYIQAPNTALMQAQTQSSMRASMSGRAGVLESEIKTDSGRGDEEGAAWKQEKLDGIQQSIQDTTKSQMGALSKANEAMKEAEKDQKAVAELPDTAAYNIHSNPATP